MMGRNEIWAISNLLKARRVPLTLGVLALGLQAFLLLPIPLLIRDIFAVRIPASDTRAVLAAGLGILALYTASTMLSLVARRLILVAVFTSVADLRVQVFTRLHDLPLSWHERQDVGRLHGTVVGDCERLGTALPPSLVAVLQALIVGIPLAIVAVVVSPLLAGVVAVVVPPILLLNGRLKARTGRAIKHWLSTHRNYAAHILRMLRATRVIRVRGADESELQAVLERIEKLTDTSIDKSWASNLASILNGAIAGVTGALILVVGGVAVTEGALALSQLLTFYAVIALMLRSVTGAAGARANLMTAVASLAPLQEIVEYPLPRIYGGEARRPFDGTVALAGVTFGYGDTPVLRNLDLVIAEGERVAVVGPNGAGKS
ncbi:MAG: ABC transporter ATP-binding protein, partial [Mycobacterium sp.]|nr:ABC transporter ATP-binding protein [Mycobacterium sp.]